MNSKIKKNLINLIDIQKDSLQKIIDHFPNTLVKLVNDIHQCKSKVVLSGIGKSGHIGTKVAATLCSTGTPAVFLHPTESLHGDLGIVTKNDIVIFISKSGENPELNLMIPTLTKLGVKIYLMTSNSDSSLAQRSHEIIPMGDIEEICPLDLAPTTSATLSLVLLDCVAMEVMRLRKFKEENYAVFHPSGRLGRRLLYQVKDIMVPLNKLPIVDTKANAKEMLHQMTKGMIGAVFVCDKSKKLLGLITDNDIRRKLENNDSFFDLSIKDIMNPNPTCCNHSDNAYEILVKMRTHKPPQTLMPVLQKNKLCGLLRLETMVQHGLI
jgi:arabinose-5-phosphate isomerase